VAVVSEALAAVVVAAFREAVHRVVGENMFDEFVETRDALSLQGDQNLRFSNPHPALPKG
jgi:hypothetical protein